MRGTERKGGVPRGGENVKGGSELKIDSDGLAIGYVDKREAVGMPV